MDRQEEIEQLKKRAERAKERRKEREQTTRPKVFLESPTLPEKSAMRQFVNRATDSPEGIREILTEVKNKKREIERLDVHNYGETGYRFHRNATALIDFIEQEWEITTESKQEDILSEECLSKIKELTEKYSAKPSDWIYKEAYKDKECQFEIKDGEKKKIGSWRTLSRRVKSYYLDLHERTFA